MPPSSLQWNRWAPCRHHPRAQTAQPPLLPVSLSCCQNLNPGSFAVLPLPGSLPHLRRPGQVTLEVAARANPRFHGRLIQDLSWIAMVLVVAGEFPAFSDFFFSFLLCYICFFFGDTRCLSSRTIKCDVFGFLECSLSFFYAQLLEAGLWIKHPSSILPCPLLICYRRL